MRIYLAIVSLLVLAQAHAAEKVIVVPPPGVPVPQAEREALETGVAELGREIDFLRAGLKGKPQLLSLLPDVQIYHNAVHYALAHDIFYKTNKPNEFEVARNLLKQGLERARDLQAGKAPWTTATGLVVRGYVSRIDGSAQPYGLVVPASYQAGAGRKHRLDVWYHGRDNNLSELKFINDRQTKAGEFTPADTFVLHPYGRYCNANKFAGELDTFEALEHAQKHYPIDENRLSVRGFSMGGAATWHMAAHHAGLWAAAAPGAGFSETAKYQKIAPDDPKHPWYERKLWALYDATKYAANLHQCPTIAYSGDEDPQRQAADVMAEAMKSEGLELQHVIGKKIGHKYTPEAKEEINRFMDAVAAKGREVTPDKVRFTTWTLRYNKMLWVTVDGLEQHWERARVNAEITGKSAITGTTENVSALTLSFPAGLCPLEGKPSVTLDGQKLTAPAVTRDRSWTAHFRKQAGKWALVKSPDAGGLAKRHGLQGPIDDAFMDSFIMVRPTGKSLNDGTSEWVAKELDYAAEQWWRQFRGQPRVKEDAAITDADIANNHLILWGDPGSNKVLARIADKLPVKWQNGQIVLNGKSYSADRHVPVLIFPNPLNPRRYVVLNTGFTFSEFGSASNSQQTPKLPDWAVIDTTVARSNRLQQGVAAAGFFGEKWGWIQAGK